MSFHLYILKCCDGSYYTGSTDNIDQRLNEHYEGVGCDYTKKRMPFEVVFSEEFSTRNEAFEAERKIKKWSRKKKEALMNGDWEEIQRLSKKNFNKN